VSGSRQLVEEGLPVWHESSEEPHRPSDPAVGMGDDVTESGCPAGVSSVDDEHSTPGVANEWDFANHPVALCYHEVVSWSVVDPKRSSHIPRMHMPFTDGNTAVLADGQGTKARPFAKNQIPIGPIRRR
jgi:hypothetical protein